MHQCIAIVCMGWTEFVWLMCTAKSKLSLFVLWNHFFLLMFDEFKAGKFGSLDSRIGTVQCIDNKGGISKSESSLSTYV